MTPRRSLIFFLPLLVLSLAAWQSGGYLRVHNHTGPSDGGKLSNLNVIGTLTSQSTATLAGVSISSISSTGFGAVTVNGAAVFAGSVLGAGFQNVQVITTSQNWTVPANVYHLEFLECGAGGGGGEASGSAGSNRTVASAGGSSGACNIFFSTTTPGANIAVTIGAGGAGSNTDETPGAGGGATEIYVNGSTITASGGSGGPYCSATNGTCGGGGGGGGCGSVPGGFCLQGNVGQSAMSFGVAYNSSAPNGAPSPLFGGAGCGTCLVSTQTGGNGANGAGGSGCTMANAGGVCSGGNGGSGEVVILY